MSDPLRPVSFDSYVGQPALLARLRILVAAAKSRGEPIAHQLLHGPPGLGKTTLAHIIANVLGVSAHVAMGPGLEKPADLTGLLTRLNPGDILFIDEIHSLNGAVGELLYPAMEDNFVSIMIDCRTHSRAVNVPLPPFTLIGATTQPGLLQAPLRDRFSLPMALEFYSDADLAIILTANAAKLGIIYETAAIELLASRSRGTPRIGNHLLRFARDVAHADNVLSVEAAQDALKLQQIDCLGLTAQDRQYLRLVIETYKGGPVGAEALAATMGLKTDTLVSVLEPYLLQAGLVSRTRQGRKTTEKAALHLAA